MEKKLCNLIKRKYKARLIKELRNVTEHDNETIEKMVNDAVGLFAIISYLMFYDEVVNFPIKRLWKNDNE